MNTIEGIQGDDAWAMLRLGCVTASNVKRIMPLKSGKYPADREAYKMELITERLTGIPMPRFQSDAMRWGVLNEPFARDLYQEKTGIIVRQVSFIESTDILNTGVSPDGLVGEDGMIEIKCPHTKTHFETIIRGSWDDDYYDQMQMQMGVAGRAWNDFCSYDPRLPDDMKLVVNRVPFDTGYWERMKQEIIKFQSEINDMIEEVFKKFPSYREDYLARWGMRNVLVRS